MPDQLGNVNIPEIVSSGVFPLVTDYGYVTTQETPIVTHRFGSANAKVEQRFLLGNGVKHFTLKFASLNENNRESLRDFWEGTYGPYGAFTYNAPSDDGATTTAYTVRFASGPLEWEQFQDFICSSGVELIEIPDPASAPTYTLNSTLTRFPNSTLNTALLSQVQQMIPLVKIQPREVGYGSIYVSDRRCTVGAQLYLPRLIDWDGIEQTMGNDRSGSDADVAQFVFGNADRAMGALACDVDLLHGDIEFSLFHVGTGIKLDLWKGYINDWSYDAGPEFRMEATDGLYELSLPYPTRKVCRTCWKVPLYDTTNACPYTANGALDLVHFPSASAVSCDGGYDTPNGCLAHGMKRYFGGIYATPQGVRILDNSTGTWGISRAVITPTSLVSESIYDQVIPESYTDTDMPVNCLIAAGRDESDFYEAMGIVGEGPVVFSSGHTLDNQFHHGYGTGTPTYGLRTLTGTDPAGLTDYFSLDQSGDQTGGDWRKVYVPDSTYLDNFAAGTAAMILRRSDEKGLQLTRPGDHQMQAIISRGLQGWIWTAPSTRSWGTLVNPIWIVVNMMLKARGLRYASAATAEGYFNVTDAVAAAAVCDEWVATLVGLTTGTCTVSRPAPKRINNPWRDIEIPVNQVQVTVPGVAGSSLVGKKIRIEGADYLIEGVTDDGKQVLLPWNPTLPANGSHTFTIYEQQFRYRGTIADEKPLRDWIAEILNNCLGYYCFDFGKLSLGVRCNSSSSDAFTVGNILFNSLQLSPLKPTFNHLTANFADDEFQFAQNSMTLFDKDHAALIGGAASPLFLKGTFPLAGTSNKNQAARLLNVRLCEELGGVNAAQWKAARNVAFKTTVLALSTGVGKVNSLTHDDMPGGAGEFRVIKWRLNKDYSIDIIGRTTTDDIYDPVAGPKPADVHADPVPFETPYDQAIPGAPAIAITTALTPHDGTILLPPITFASYVNVSTIDTATFDVYYSDELLGELTAAGSDGLGSITDSATSIDVVTGTAATCGFAVDEYAVISHAVPTTSAEIVKITNVSGDTLTVERGQLGTTAVAHTYGGSTIVRIDRLHMKTVSFPFKPTFFDGVQNLKWQDRIILPSARITTIKLKVHNIYGDSPTATYDLTTYDSDPSAIVGSLNYGSQFGLRTWSGIVKDIEIPGDVTLGDYSGPRIIVPADCSLGDCHVTLKTAPTGTGAAQLQVQLYRNGDAWLPLWIAQGATSSNYIAGAGAAYTVMHAGDEITATMSVYDTGTLVTNGADLSIQVRG